MKKLVALAVAGAFIAPVYAAEISISGDQEWSYKESNSTTTTGLDGDFNIKASTTTTSGLKISADLNQNASGGSDGGNSLTIAGPFGKVDLGDTSSAADAIDDVTEWGYVLGQGTDAADAALLWTLPAFAPGLTLNLSWSGDSNFDSNAAGTGMSASYSNSGLKVGYGITDYDAGNEDVVVNLSYAFAGVKVAYEQFTSTTAAGVDTDVTNLGAVYSLGDLTLALETTETESNNTVTVDDMVFGVHYALGGGVTAFLEQLNAASASSSSDTTAVGVAFAF